jgi:Multicopper oxidase
MLSSHDGKLNVDLVAAPATYTIGGHRFEGMLYNGQYMPSAWRLRSGDILTVTLHNQLSEKTNLHFHGLGVSPLNNGDNVFLHIAPNETFTYQIKIPEKHVGLFGFTLICMETLTDKSSVACPEEFLLRAATASTRS